MIRLLNDKERGLAQGAFVPINVGIDVADVKRDVHCPSGTMLAYYKQYFRTEQDFADFLKRIIANSTGEALNGRLTWSTP